MAINNTLFNMGIEPGRVVVEITPWGWILIGLAILILVGLVLASCCRPTVVYEPPPQIGPPRQAPIMRRHPTVSTLTQYPRSMSGSPPSSPNTTPEARTGPGDLTPGGPGDDDADVTIAIEAEEPEQPEIGRGGIDLLNLSIVSSIQITPPPVLNAPFACGTRFAFPPAPPSLISSPASFRPEAERYALLRDLSTGSPQAAQARLKRAKAPKAKKV